MNRNRSFSGGASWGRTAVRTVGILASDFFEENGEALAAVFGILVALLAGIALVGWLSRPLDPGLHVLERGFVVSAVLFFALCVLILAVRIPLDSYRAIRSAWRRAKEDR